MEYQRLPDHVKYIASDFIRGALEKSEQNLLSLVEINVSTVSDIFYFSLLAFNL